MQLERKFLLFMGTNLIPAPNSKPCFAAGDLDPLILDQLPSEGQTIIEKLEKHTSEANFCVVLATPDDVGFRAGHEDEKAHRARQNVVLELGMMLSKLGRKRSEERRVGKEC